MARRRARRRGRRRPRIALGRAGAMLAARKPTPRRLPWSRSSSRRPRSRAARRRCRLVDRVLGPAGRAAHGDRARQGGRHAAVAQRGRRQPREGRASRSARIDLADLQTRVTDAQRSSIRRRPRSPRPSAAPANVGLAARTSSRRPRCRRSQARLDAARAQLNSAQAQLATSRIGMREAALLAPISGIVGKRHVVPGEKVSAEQPVLTVVDLPRSSWPAPSARTRSRCSRPGSRWRCGSKGTTARWPAASTASRRRPRPARARSASSSCSRTRTSASAPASTRRRAVRLADPQQRLTVPVAAVGQTSGQDYVWTLEKDALRAAHRRHRPRATRRRAASRSSRGLAPDAQVLAMRFDNLKEGAPAKVVAQRSAPTASNPARRPRRRPDAARALDRESEGAAPCGSPASRSTTRSSRRWSWWRCACSASSRTASCASSGCPTSRRRSSSSASPIRAPRPKRSRPS